MNAGVFSELMKDPPAINDDALNKLVHRIEMKQRVYTTAASDGNEMAYFVGDVFEHMISLCHQECSDDRLKLALQVEMAGEHVKASVVANWLISDGKKCVCVVEAKHWGFLLGDVQCVLGMKLAAEKNEHEEINGMVTNYTEWHLLKRTDDGIEMVKNLINPRKPVREDLQGVASRVYAILNA